MHRNASAIRQVNSGVGGSYFSIKAFQLTLFREYLYMSGPGSSVGIATDYWLDGPRIESRWGRDFPPVQIGPGVNPASCTMGTGSFPGVKCGRGILLTTHPLLAPKSWKSRAIPLPPLWATTRPITGLLYFLYIIDNAN